jgi:hypothetical protein
MHEICGSYIGFYEDYCLLDSTPCSVINHYQHFGGALCLRFHRKRVSQHRRSDADTGRGRTGIVALS